jgi:hypothetical protein
MFTMQLEAIAFMEKQIEKLALCIDALLETYAEEIRRLLDTIPEINYDAAASIIAEKVLT